MIYTIEFNDNDHINLLQESQVYSYNETIWEGYEVAKEKDEIPDGLYPGFFTLVIRNEGLEEDLVYDALSFGKFKCEASSDALYTQKIDTYTMITDLMENAKETMNTLFIVRYTDIDIDFCQLSTRKLIRIIEDFIDDCEHRNSGNQLVLFTDRFELMDYTTAESVWLCGGDLDVYSLGEFHGVEEFQGKLARNYRIGRFGGV
jgi:hypothetical protein